MTTLIQQKTLNDCALASIAMAAGTDKWEDLWTEADLEAIKGKGVGHGEDLDAYMLRAGFIRRKHYKTVYLHGDVNDAVYDLLWGRRALLSVRSLNRDGGGHMVYWDGERLWDPSYERTYLHLSSCIITVAQVLKD